MAVRRKVLGDKHVARRQESPDRSSKQQDEVVTELAWGKIWSRPQLPLKLRSLVTIAMLAALNRADELNWARERRTRTTGRLLRRSSEVFVRGAAPEISCVEHLRAFGRRGVSRARARLSSAFPRLERQEKGTLVVRGDAPDAPHASWTLRRWRRNDSRLLFRWLLPNLRTGPRWRRLARQKFTCTNP
jgi:hypothetical protein